jgi:hypothetical protein
MRIVQSNLGDFCTNYVSMFSQPAQNFSRCLRPAMLHDQTPGFTLCHSEEPCDEESAFDFLTKTGTTQSRCFTEFTLSFAEGFSMTQLMPERRGIPFSWRLLRLCARSNFGCGSAALGSLWSILLLRLLPPFQNCLNLVEFVAREIPVRCFQIVSQMFTRLRPGDDRAHLRLRQQPSLR